jgi:hypothetical protein
MTGEGVLWHPTSSGAPWPFLGGSTVHAHISPTQHPDTPVSLTLPSTPPGQDLTRLTIEIQDFTQGFRLMAWNHTLLVPVLNRLKEARVLNKMVQASIPPLLAFFFLFFSSRKLLDRNGNDPEFGLLLNKFLLA